METIREQYVGTREIATALSCDPQTVRNLLRKGVLPHIRFGRKLLVKRDDFERFIQRLTQSGE